MACSSDATTDAETGVEAVVPEAPAPSVLPTPQGAAGDPGSSAGDSSSAPGPTAAGTGEAPGDLPLTAPEESAPGTSAPGSESPPANEAPAPPAVPMTSGPLPLVYDEENTGADCPAAPGPVPFAALPAVPNLPDPFLLSSGERMTRRDQWRCRRSEISSLIQYWGTGPKQTPEVQAFVDKFLRGDTSANTAVARDPYRTDLSSWVTWSTPELE